MRLTPQRELLSRSINESLSKEKRFVEEIVNLPEFIINKEVGFTLRQDYVIDPKRNINVMSNGVQAEYTDRELELMSGEISESVIKTGKKGNSFDLHNHYNTHIYLPQLIMNAHALNNLFQQCISDIFNVSNVQTGRTDKFHAFYTGAPVKEARRAMVKAETDYGGNRFPTTGININI